MRVLLLLLALAACSEPVESVPEVEKSDPIATTNTPADSNPSTPAPVAVAIPAAFRGRWALVPLDCDASRGDNKGLMTVEADIIRFYESRARPRSVTETAPDSLSADLAVEGEGQTWSKTTRFTLAGDTLRSDSKQDGQPDETLTYRRCPA